MSRCRERRRVSPYVDPRGRLANFIAGQVSWVPPLADATNEVLWADLWRRPVLNQSDRSLVTVAALVATGKAAQIHANGADF